MNSVQKSVLAVALIVSAAPHMALARDSVRCLPNTVSVVDSEEIARTGRSDVADVLRRVPGVRGRGGPDLAFDRADSTIAVRGAGTGGTQPLIVIDGRPVGRNGVGGTNTTMPPPDSIDNVEVLRGPAATAIYGHAGVNGVVIVTTRDHERTGFATENLGSLQNPATSFEFGLSGTGMEANIGACIDVGLILPVDIGLSYMQFDLSGSGSISNEQYLGGFGVTGIGGVPGVFVGSPTDLTRASIDVERTGTQFSLDFDVPLTFSGFGTSSPGPAVANVFQRPSYGSTSLLFGVRAGTLDQSETTEFSADTPAFGIDSSWQGSYDTEFDGRFRGAYLGIGTSRTFYGASGSTTTFGLSGIVGIDAYEFEVSERVEASGLGGLLNYANSETHSFTDELLSGRVTGSVNWQRGNFSLGGFVRFDTGLVPELERFLPDSDVFGALDPEYGISDTYAPSVTLGFGGMFRF